jgi:DnaD/phage-associated family protein
MWYDIDTILKENFWMQLQLRNNAKNTIVPNDFIRKSNGAPSEFIVAYLFGLMYSQSCETLDLSVFGTRLNMREDEVIEAFEYWQKKGLVHIQNGETVSLEFGEFDKQQTQDDDLYTESEFNQKLQQIFGARQLNGEDYKKIYDYTDVFLLPKEVVLAMANYCVTTKGKSVSVSYLDKVAKSWAEDEINTEQKALDYIEERKVAASGVIKVLKQLGLSNRKPTKDESALFEKWTSEWGFTLSAILTACAHTTAAREPSMKYLDSILARLKQAGNMTSRKISESKRASEDINKDIQELMHIIGEKNMSPNAAHKQLLAKWTNAYGYDMNVIGFAAEQASFRGKMPFTYLDGILTDWFNQGIETIDDAKEYISGQQRNDSHILAVFDAAGIAKLRATEAHRRKYELWTEQWGMSRETILLGAEISSLASKPYSYLCTLLSNWHKAGVTSITDAQKQTQKRKDSSNSSSTASNKRETKNYDHLAVDLFDEEGA